MNRQQANFLILSILTDYITRNPDTRFQQALWNLDLIRRDSEGEFIDEYYSESVDTLAALRELE